MINMVHSKATVYSEESREGEKKNTHIYIHKLIRIDASYRYGEGYDSNYSVHKYSITSFTLLLKIGKIKFHILDSLDSEPCAARLIHILIHLLLL